MPINVVTVLYGLQYLGAFIEFIGCIDRKIQASLQCVNGATPCSSYQENISKKEFTAFKRWLCGLDCSLIASD
jgi:hypothetical protein